MSGTELERGFASYNVHRCIGADGRSDPARIARVIAELDCVAVGLQEVDFDRDAEGGRGRQLELLADATGMRALSEGELGEQRRCGNALLSRVPVRRLRQHDLAMPGREPRNALDAELEIDGALVRVISTHLGLSAAERRRQIHRLIEVIALDPCGRVVVLGDFNEWLPVSRGLGWLEGELGRTRAVRSFPARLPVLGLDRIWVRPREALVSVQAHASPLARVASDHLPVRACIAFA